MLPRGVGQLGASLFFPTSCDAAARAKPKARLCEPWVALKTIVRSRGAATASMSIGIGEGRAIRLVRQIFASTYLGHRSAAPNKFITTLTQGSQSLALGLVLTAASQLVESRRSEPARSKGRRNRIAASKA